eukprot:gene8585-9289_t
MEFVHNTPRSFRPHKDSKASQYGVIVGKVVRSSEHSVAGITGRSGDHLQFNLDIGNDQFFQVSVNVRSRHGTNIEVFIADEDHDSCTPPKFGQYRDAKLSYSGLGLTDGLFRQISEKWITSKLEAELNASEYVEVYGTMFKDGRLNGIHNVHFTGLPDQDGAIAIYGEVPEDCSKTIRTWVFLKFSEQSIETY